MATTLIESQIKDRIAAFVAELDRLVRQSALEAVRSVLADGAALSARRGRPAGSGRGPGRPAGSGGAPGDSIVAHVRTHDGQTVGEIARSTGIAPAAAKKAIVKLLAAGLLTKTGQRRGTRYHAGSGSSSASPAASGRRTKRGKRRGRKAKAA